jgi:hypothetical protein
MKVTRRSSRHADLMDWDELVILRAGSGSDSVVPQWHIRTERYVELLRDVRAESRPEGLLIELLICLNGTGGCSSEYLLATDELQHVESNVARFPGTFERKEAVIGRSCTWSCPVVGRAGCDDRPKEVSRASLPSRRRMFRMEDNCCSHVALWRARGSTVPSDWKGPATVEKAF